MTSGEQIARFVEAFTREHGHVPERVNECIAQVSEVDSADLIEACVVAESGDGYSPQTRALLQLARSTATAVHGSEEDRLATEFRRITRPPNAA